MQRDDGDEELCSVFVPTNHLYIGDILLVNSKEVIRPNLSIREGRGMFSVFTHAIICEHCGAHAAYQKQKVHAACRILHYMFFFNLY